MNDEYEHYSENEPDEQCVKHEDDVCWGCGECGKY